MIRSTNYFTVDIKIRELDFSTIIFHRSLTPNPYLLSTFTESFCFKKKYRPLLIDHFD